MRAVETDARGRWRARRRCRPVLMVLEDRRLLSTFQVNSTVDNVNTAGTLRWAVAQANNATTPSNIEFELGAAATITLTQGQLELSNTKDAVTIDDGPSQGPVTISGNNASRVFLINTGVTATLSGLAITKGSAPIGGGVYNLGTLTLTGCTVSGNSANGNGGALDNFATLTLTGCTVSGNLTGGNGGGLNNFATLTLKGCTVSGNSAGTVAGGLENVGTLTLTGCTVSGNSAGLAAGGLNNTGTLTLTGCTVSGNSAHYGGGLDNFATLTLTVSTVSKNSAAEGKSGGLYNSEGSATLVDTIVAGNTAGSVPGDINDPGASKVAGTNNLIGPGGSGGITGGVGGNIVLTDLSTLGLAPLGEYGGPTQTMALLPGSAAIAAGSAVSGVTTDQRGMPLHTPTPDIGAFQTNPLVVNTTIDAAGSPAGDLSLRQAVNLANALGGAQTITFDPTVFAAPQTITLSASLGVLSLTDTTGTEAIDGPTAGVTVSGGKAVEVLSVSGNVTASLSGLTITEGSAHYGGGVDNFGTLTLTDCTVSGNSGHYGGGLFNNTNAKLTLTGCTISGNSAYYGGGFANYATLTLTGCTVSGNSAQDGGGLANYATLTLTGCTVSGNSAGGFGGGLNNVATMTLTGSTVSGNSAGGDGGGLDNFGTLTLTGTTVSGNSAGGDGGGLFNNSTLTLSGCTVSGNSTAEGKSGGLYNFKGSTTLVDTIVASNTAGTVPGDIKGAGASKVTGTNNLIGPGGSGGITCGVGSNFVLTNLSTLGLASLGEYGGPTQTMALLPGSAAIAAGIGQSNITTDQRGAPRATSGAIDIGAFEVQGYTLALVTGSPQSTTISQTFASPLVAVLSEDYAESSLPGATIEFTTPSSGDSATLSAGSATTGATGQANVMATANAIAGAYTASASAGTGLTTTFQLTNQVAPSFSGLTDQTTSYGSTVTFTGTLAAGTQSPPAGADVAVTVNGVTHDVPLAAAGSFSAQFTRTDVVLNASPTAYTVTYSYATDGVFLDAPGSSQLTVNPATLTAAIVGNPARTYDGTTDASLNSANFILSGLVGGDGFTVTQTAGTYNSKDVTTATTVTATLAEADLTPGSGTLAGNYTFPTTASGAGQITPAPLTITATSDAKVYDGITSSGKTPAYGTLYGGDTVTGLAEAFARKDCWAPAAAR